MATVSRYARASRADVFATLVRAETYPEWLVGCRSIDSIDESWPQVGACFHHRYGLIGPIAIPDTTEVLEIDDGRMLALEVRARPLGRGRATFVLNEEPAVDGCPVTRITLDETPLGTLATLSPLLDPLVQGRNIASLNALVAYLNTPARSTSTDSSEAAASPQTRGSDR